ncbi:MAG: cation:proton antiporter [Desulfobacterales bacterium]|jgi:CPA2 family monovalent cation:H+ antiporter-2
MEIWKLIGEILLLLLGAFLLGALAQRLKQSAIIGYLLAGIVLGPLLFNRQAVMSVAELGVALLLFSIGLEFSLGRLKRMGSIALVGGSLQVLLTMGLFAGLFVLFHPPASALAIGALVALSSTAIVLRVLVDRAEIDSVHGRSALGVLLVQDVAVVPLVLFITILTGGGNSLEIAVTVGRTLGAAVAIVALFYILYFQIIPRLLLKTELFSNRELVVLLTILLAVGSIWAAHSVGLSPSLGAFLAGMLLAESPFAAQVRSDIGSIRVLFVTLFFVSIGMLADPGWFLSNWSVVFLWLFLVVIGKTLIVYLIFLFFKIGHGQALATGISLSQMGEFSFVLGTIAKTGGLIDGELFALIVSVTIFSMFIAPYAVSYAIPLARWSVGLFSSRQRSLMMQQEKSGLTTSGRILIIGFGPAGQEVADALIKEKLRPEVIELNPKTAQIAREKGLPLHLGDASGTEMLEKGGIHEACIVVVTVPDPRSAAQIIRTIHLLSPDLPVIARSRYQIAVPDLQRAGAVVIDEEHTVGIAIAREVIEVLRQPQNEAMACALAGQRPEEENPRD